MTKKELLQNCWIPYTKRLPPDTDEVVIAWNYARKTPWPAVSFVLRKDAAQLVKDPNCFRDSHNIALFTSHWMKLPGPTNDQANSD